MIAAFAAVLVLAPAPTPLVVAVEPHHVVGAWDWTFVWGLETVIEMRYRVDFREDGTCRFTGRSRHGGLVKGTWRVSSRDGTLRVHFQGEERTLTFPTVDAGKWVNRKRAGTAWWEEWEGRKMYHSVEARKR